MPWRTYPYEDKNVEIDMVKTLLKRVRGRFGETKLLLYNFMIPWKISLSPGGNKKTLTVC